MFNKRGEENFKEAETIIGQSVRVKGDFNGNGDIIVEGIVNGSLKTRGKLRVGDSAKITASVEAKEAKIGGEIRGNVKIKNYLELTANAKILGDIEASILSIEKGALVNGKCTMTHENNESKISASISKRG